MNGFESLTKNKARTTKYPSVSLAHHFRQINRRGDAGQRLVPPRLFATAKTWLLHFADAGRTQRFAPTKTFMALMLLASCAPVRGTTTQTQAPSPTVSSIVGLAVNPNGDAVCIPSNSSMAAHFPRAAIRGQMGHGWFEAPLRIASAAWQNGAWWLALPRGGLVQKADGVPQSLSVAGQPSLLSSRLIFTLEGDVFRYDGTRVVGRLPSLPSSLVDGKNVTFVLSGKEVFSITDSVTPLRQLENTSYSVTLGSPLSALPEQANYLVVRGVAVSQNDYTYSLEKNTIKVNSATGQFLKNIALSGTGSRIAVGGDTLVVAIGSSVAFFDARSFVPLIARACEVTR